MASALFQRITFCGHAGAYENHRGVGQREATPSEAAIVRDDERRGALKPIEPDDAPLEAV
jgi:hypothetical protein